MICRKRFSIGLVLSLGVSLSFFACNDDRNPAKQYGNTMIESLKTTKNVEQKVNLLEVQKSIQEFNAANGRYPADLSEIAAITGTTLESGRYDYNASTGTLTVKQ